MKKIKPIYSGLLVAALGSLSSPNAFAHNFRPHSAITRAAATAMHLWIDDNTTATFCPAALELPLTDDDVHTFKAQVSAALTNLQHLQTGLNPVQFDTTRCNTTRGSSGQEVPLYYAEDNLDKMGQFRIEDFRYVVERNYTTGCKLKPLRDDSLTNESWRVLGSVLGTLAGDVDNRTKDTVLWIKPTNAYTWGFVKDAASVAVGTAGAVLLLPAACLISLFSGGDCGDSKHWMSEYNPVDYVAGWVPGCPANFTGQDLGIDMNGIWHFQQTAQRGNLMAFANSPSGMYYPAAGPAQVPGALDAAIMGVAALSGVSLNADKSLGVRDFGRYDESHRANPLFQAHHIGVTEFTPLSKLGQYGTHEYRDAGAYTAAKLGYPLHAIADATFPHHLANTTSWGHRPMEDAIDDNRLDILKYDMEDDVFVDDCHRPVEIVLRAYEYWKHFNIGSGGHVDIEELVESLAGASRSRVDSHVRVWSDSASDQYLVGMLASDADMQMSISSYVREDYGNGEDLVSFYAPFEIEAAGAALAFLVDAGLAVDPADVDESTRCEVGTVFVHDKGCLTQEETSLPNEDDDAKPTGTTSPPDNTCHATGAACSADAECCIGLCLEAEKICYTPVT